MGVTKTRNCRDCEPESKRPAPHPGPRCATHHRVATKAKKERNHSTYVARTYGVTRDFYQRLLDTQNGRCAICQRATGKARRLAVDHDHRTGQPRGALCSPCNRVVGIWFDNPDTFRRAANYLEHPPAAPLLIAANEDWAATPSAKPSGANR